MGPDISRRASRSGVMNSLQLPPCPAVLPDPLVQCLLVQLLPGDGIRVELPVRVVEVREGAVAVDDPVRL